jgi:hypothetical protein
VGVPHRGSEHGYIFVVKATLYSNDNKMIVKSFVNVEGSHKEPNCAKKEALRTKRARKDIDFLQ